MNKLVQHGPIFFLLVVLVSVPTAAIADIKTSGILDSVHDTYATVASSWATVIKAYASRLFWTLALISMVWTFGMLALRNADVAEFFAEFIRFTIFTGFYWWLLDNGPTIAVAIIDSMRTIGNNASAGSHASAYTLPSPSSIVDIGFEIFTIIVDRSSLWSPFTSIVAAFLSLAIIIILALIAVNVLIVLISAWVLAYAGIFFLGFGGSRWTSDMAIGYFKTVLGVGVQLLVMVLLVGVAKSFIDLFYSHMSEGLKLSEIAAFLVVVLVMFALINKLPGLLSGLVTGGGTGALGAGFGARDAIAAATMAATALSAVGSALTSAAANVAGGVQALMAAISKGSEAESQSSGIDRDFMAGQSGGESQSGGNGESPLAQAMGSDNSQNSSGSSNKKSGDGSSGSSGSSQKSSGSQSSSAASGSASGIKSTNRQSQPSGGAGAKAARVAAGAASSLTSGIAQVAKNSFNARVSNTFGGKVAQAIRESGTASKASASANTFSAGHRQDIDPDAEVAAFRDRGQQDDDNPDPEPSKK